MSELYGFKKNLEKVQVRSKSESAAKSHLVPTLISSTPLAAPATRYEYATRTIPELVNWNVVVLYCKCGNTQQNIICFRNAVTGNYLIDALTSTVTRGVYSVDWANNRILVRWVDGRADLAQSFVQILAVYGLVQNVDVVDQDTEDEPSGDEGEDIDISALTEEVQGIRIGADGTIYETAGEAVREQYNKLAEMLDVLNVEDAVQAINDAVDTAIQQIETAGGLILDPTLTQSGQAADAGAVGDKIDKIAKASFEYINGTIETPSMVNGTWANGGPVAGGNRARTSVLLLIKFNGKVSFGLSSYTKYKFGYMLYKSSDLTQYTNSGWITNDVTDLDFSGYAIGFNFAHLSGSGAIPASELEEIHNLFSISVTGYMYTLRSEVDELQSNVTSLLNNPLPKIGANPFRMKPCYDHLFVNSKTDAVIPHESLYHVRMSKKFGFDVMEANVSKTSDNVYIVNHLENYKFGDYFHHVDGVTDISNTLLSSVTWDWVVENVRYNSAIAKYQTRPCRLEEFLQECKQQNLIPFITSSDTNVIAIADQYMGKDNYIAYGASREDCPHAIIYHWVSSLTTKEDILAYCENIGKPFIFGLGNVSDFTDAGLKELVETLHENGYMIGISYSDNNVHKYSAFGFDTIGTIRHINRIKEGNLCNLNSIFDFSGFTYTNATLSDGVLTFSSAGTISPNIANNTYPLCGFDVEIDMIGTVTIPAVGEQKSSYNLTSDGSYPVFCATPIINGSPAITINVASGTVIKDIFFKASVF